MNLCTFYIRFLSSTEEAHIQILITYSDVFTYPILRAKGRDNLQVLIHRITKFQHLALKNLPQTFEVKAFTIKPPLM